MTQTYRIKISYDGTDYFGWQRQPDKKTIQYFLEEALFQITSERLPVIGAGRTDAGVHALGQVAHFKVDSRLADKEFLRAFNGHLPRDIRLTALSRVSSSFHARKSAKSKVYRYRIVNAPSISPFVIRYALHWPGPLDIERMRDAAAQFVREADFSAFSSNRFLNPVRTITKSELIGRAGEAGEEAGPGLDRRRAGKGSQRGRIFALHGPEHRRHSPRGRQEKNPTGTY